MEVIYFFNGGERKNDGKDRRSSLRDEASALNWNSSIKSLFVRLRLCLCAGRLLRFPPEKLQGFVQARQSGGECQHTLCLRARIVFHVDMSEPPVGRVVKHAVIQRSRCLLLGVQSHEARRLDLKPPKRSETIQIKMANFWN